MTRRTELQLALLVMGLIVWGYGQRTDDARLTWFGIGFFAVATALRLLGRRSSRDEPVPPKHDPPSD